jgi:hypothetical protein
MIAKHSIKVFTLYDLVANNTIFIIITLWNSMSAIFNHYTIQKLSLLQSILTNYTVELGEIQRYIIICQSLTFMALVFSFYFIDPILEYNVNKNRCQLLVFFVSFVWKSLATLCLNLNNTYELFDNGIPHDLFCFLLQSSFMLIFMFITIMLVGILGMSLAFMFATCSLCTNKIITWSKTQHISLINKTSNDGSEDV